VNQSQAIGSVDFVISYVQRYIGLLTVAYAENSHGVGFIQWHMAVICIWCPLFVTSQFDVIFMFPNQHFAEVF